MKRFRNGMMLVCMLMFVFFASGCFKTAGPGELGIKVNLAGDDRGVEDIPVSTGRIWYNPITQSVIIVPTYMQQETWSGQDEITFSSSEGLIFTADVTTQFSLVKEKVPALYVEYRRSIDEIIDSNLRSWVRKTINDVAGTYAAEDIYGPKKESLMAEVTGRLNDRYGDIGFNFDFVAFAGTPRPPGSLVDAINLKIEATQRAQQRENELREAQAAAEKVVAEAEGAARSQIVAAQAEAEAVEIRAKAQAEANRILVESLGGAENFVQLETVKSLGDDISIMLVPSESMPVFGVDALVKQGR